MLSIHNIQNRPKLIKIKEQQAVRICKKCQSIKDPKKKAKCLGLCIKKSLELDKLEQEEKSF